MKLARDEVRPGLPSPPRWAWLLAATLATCALVVFFAGRGGTAMLLAVSLGFGALAVLLLSMGDSLPDDE